MEQKNTAVAPATPARPAAPAAGTKARAFLTEIEVLKGLAILLVVWGHVHDPAFPEWILVLRRAIYAFHMPLFLFLSGYVFVHVGSHVARGSLSTFTRKRAHRLLLPFAVMAVLVVAGKLAAGQVLRVDNPVDDLLGSIAHLFVGTEDSPVQFIWYLVVLFYFSVATVFLHGMIGLRLRTLLIIAIAMHVLHVALFYAGVTLDTLYFNRVLMYYVFFMAGCVARDHQETWEVFVQRWWPVALAVFLALQVLLLRTEWRYLFVGLASLVLFHGFARTVLKDNRFLRFIGGYAFAIYLTNMLAIGTIKALFDRFVAPVEAHALPVIVICLVAAVSGAIVLMAILRRVPPLRGIARAME